LQAETTIAEAIIESVRAEKALRIRGVLVARQASTLSATMASRPWGRLAADALERGIVRLWPDD
jgi:hypothetical protein